MSKKQAEANIQTFLRIRPSKAPSGYFTQDEIEQGSLQVSLPSNFKTDYVNNSKLQHAFHFNGIIDANATQDDVFKKVGVAAVQNAIEGFNSTIFAYGQTGSGKTFTLTGGPEKYSDRGIIPRAISMLYNEYRNRSDIQFKAYISYLELYNEQGYDLLDPSHETKALEDLPKVKMLEDGDGNYHLKNLSMHAAETEAEALELLFLGDTNRAIAETPMNMASSRSHCIFTISLECRVIGTDKVRRSKLHLVDLAGSERVAKTNSSGSVLTEAQYINTSLFFLEMVIVALYEKATKGRGHIPYRNSMMTSVLRDSLGGNCKTIMIATINPESSHTEESLSTCKFAQRVSLIKNKALLNEESDPSIIIRRLKDELLTLREEISFLKGEAGEGDALSLQELEDLKTLCRQYCYDLDPHSTLNIGAMTLTKIKDVFAIMKNLVLENSSSGGGKGSSGDGSTSNSPKPPASEETAQLIKQIKDLKSLLLQRDSEIQILVNMVQKGKTVEDISGAQLRTSHSSSSGMNGYNREDDSDSVSHRNNTTITTTSSSNPQLSKQQQQLQNKTYLEQQQLMQIQREKENQERIIKRHLFGVPPPTERAIFDDGAASFEWFRDRCSLSKVIETNKGELKDKITEAKLMGDRANQSRNTITYLKNSIEAIRRERVLHRLNVPSEGKEGEAEVEGSGEEEVESEEEVTYRRAIDQEKVVYKESFDRLRVLKGEIEHVRQMIEKNRATMQNQFDQWYQNLHARNGIIGSSHASAYIGSGGSSSVGGGVDTSTIASTQVGVSNGGGGYHNTAAGSGSNNLSQSFGSFSRQSEEGTEAYYRTPQQQRRPLSRGMEYKQPSSDAEAKNYTSSSSNRSTAGTSGMSAQEYARRIPSTIGTTTNASTVADSKVEDDVNEDILAFYQAKEEMLKMRNAALSNNTTSSSSSSSSSSNNHLPRER